MTKMETNLFGIVKDFTAYVCSYKLALTLLPLEPQYINGLFGLAGIVLGRVLDWSFTAWKTRRARRKARRKLSH